MTKRFLGILVLCLLVCSVANARSFHDLIKPGMTKEQVRKLTEVGWQFTWPLYKTHELKALGGSRISAAAFCPSTGLHPKEYIGKKYSNQYKYFPEYKTEVFTHTPNRDQPEGRNFEKLNGWPWYVFENVTKPIKCKTSGANEATPYKGSDGILKAVVWSKEEALILADPSYAKKIKDQKKAEEQKRMAEEKKREEIKIAKEKKTKEEELKKLVSRYGNKCEKRLLNPTGFEKDTPEFNNCLIAKQEDFERKESERIKIENEKKIAEAKRLEMEEEMLKNLTPQERAEYKCINTFEFKKGSSQYTECLFKLYTVELELEKMKLEHEVQKQRLALEREKLKTAQAQTQAARAQADAAYRSAIANENQAYQLRRRNAQRSINQGMRMINNQCTFGVNC